MSRWWDEDKASEFDLLTQKMRKGKIAFRNECIPELAAWLCVHAMSYRRILGQLRKPSQFVSDTYTEGMKRHCEKAIDVLQSLMNSLGKNWDRHSWNEATGYISDQLGLKHNVDCPKKMGDGLAESPIFTGVSEPCQQEILEPDSLPNPNVPESPIT